MTRKFWTKEEDNLVIEKFPHVNTIEIAKVLNRSYGSVARRADGKPSMKTGYYFRGATEHFIFATKGNLRLKDKAVEPTLFLSERLPHSVKPEWFYELVNRCSFDNKLELFARQEREGYDCFGNQVTNSVNLEQYLSHYA